MFVTLSYFTYLILFILGSTGLIVFLLFIWSTSGIQSTIPVKGKIVEKDCHMNLNRQLEKTWYRNLLETIDFFGFFIKKYPFRQKISQNRLCNYVVEYQTQDSYGDRQTWRTYVSDRPDWKYYNKENSVKIDVDIIDPSKATPHL